MIDRGEILELAGELGLRPDVVEKDYVLGWLLAGIAAHPALGATWVFKGGTCLKKCYFETYRFSEDLDFTVENEDQLNEQFLREAFGDVAAWIYDHIGIEIPVDQLRFEVYRNPRNGLNCEGRVYYRGPLQPGGSLPRIKLDLTADEQVVRPPDQRPVVHLYTDGPDDGMTARCYAFEEVFGEKIRALGERVRPRDLYDVINLFRNEAFRPAASAILDVVREKCSFKDVPIPNLAALQAFRDELAGDWQAMLGHQLPTLPPFEAFWAALPEFFAWLERGAIPAVPAGIPITAGEEVVRAPTRGFGVGLAGASVLEIVRFAAANRLCVDLGYGGSTRRIEPYSLRQTLDGNLVLHAVRADSGEHRSYRVDRMQGAKATDQAFTPKYAIELTPTGPLPVLPTARESGVTKPSVRRTSRRPSRRSGPVYVYECGMCGKRFRRTKQDSRLRSHKTKDGWQCSGRTGWLVDTRY